MQNRTPVGCGPSSKTWPRCDSQRAQRTSTRTMPWLRSSMNWTASGYEVRTVEGLTETLDECVSNVGLESLGSLHLNDSQNPLGSNRDRHANIWEGELGYDGCTVFLSEPRFQDLPCVLETPGPNKEGPTAEEIAKTRALRDRGRADRGAE